MKNILFLLCCLLSLLSCTKEDIAADPVLTVNPDTLVFQKGKVTGDVKVIATHEWGAQVEEGGEWCVVEVVSELLKVSVSENKNVNERWAVIDVHSGELHHKVRVCQFGSKPAMLIKPAELKDLPYEPAETEVMIITNVELVVSLPDSIKWISVAERKGEQDTVLVRFETGLNTAFAKRETKITVKQKDGELTHWIPVTQLGCPNGYEVLEPEGITGDSLLKVKSAWASSFQSGAGIEKSFDGNMGTLYHSNWSNKPSDYFPITLDYNFESTDRLDYVVYYPRTDGSNGLFKQVEIWYKTESTANWTKRGDFDFRGSSMPSSVTFPEGLEKPTAVRFVVKSGSGDGQGFASCAEMQFYQKTETAAATVFLDETYSALSDGVTYEQIMKMENEFLRNIAKALYLKIYPLEDRVKNYQPYRNPEAIASEYKINAYNRLDNPTGIYGRSGEEVVVFVGEIPDGEQIGLCQMDWKKGYSSTNYFLKSGMNKLTMKADGLLYIMYNTEKFKTVDPIKIHIASGTINGCFDMEQGDTDVKWQKLLSQASSASGFLDLRGEYAHLCFPVSDYKSNVGSPTALLREYDRMVRLEHELMGLPQNGHIVKNHMFFHAVFDDSYMYATSYRTAYQQGTLKEILNVGKFKTSAIWGPAHEVGHMHQTRPGLKWIGTTEVTNNIHSMNVQVAFGNPTRLMTEDLGNGLTRYEKAFTSIVAKKTAHGNEGDVFCKLVPFWQLQLYATKVAGKPNLYPDLHEKIRNTIYPSDDSKNGISQLTFVRYSSEILDENLTDFFRAWGFLREIDVLIEDYAKEMLTVTTLQIKETEAAIARYPSTVPGGLIYMNDNNVKLFINKAPVVAGTVTRTDQKITLNGWENVVAWELCNGEQILLVRQRTTFDVPKDVIGDWSAGEFFIRGVAFDGTRTSIRVGQ